MKQSVTVGAQLLWGGRYGCNNGRYGCTIVMSYIEINKAVSQWLLTFNLCISVTWPLTCAFHIPCTHTPEIIDMHRGVCDNAYTCNMFSFALFSAFLCTAKGRKSSSSTTGFTCSIRILPRWVTWHDDVIKWKHFPRYWPFVWGIYRSPVNSPHKGQWRGALMFSLICAWINGWVNNGEASDLRRHHAHYDVNVMRTLLDLIEALWCINVPMKLSV